MYKLQNKEGPLHSLHVKSIVSAIAEDVCPERKVSFEDSLSTYMCTRHMQELAANLFEQLKLQMKSFAIYNA